MLGWTQVSLEMCKRPYTLNCWEQSIPAGVCLCVCGDPINRRHARGEQRPDRNLHASDLSVLTSTSSAGRLAAAFGKLFIAIVFFPFLSENILFILQNNIQIRADRTEKGESIVGISGSVMVFEHIHSLHTQT